MQLGYPSVAAEDYRTALTYKREDNEYRLRLAQALMADGRFNEARAHLLSLWEEDPADGEVNLSLARLYAQHGTSGEAVRYYRNAINGVWGGTTRDHRVAARFELVHYLLSRHDTRQAAAELIALQADPPEDEQGNLELAQLLLQVQEAARAQAVYEGILKTDPGNLEALLGNGKSSFALGDYFAAERELSAAVARDPSSQEARSMLALAREILRVSPGIRGLTLADRVRRVANAFDAAFQHIATCAQPPGTATGGNPMPNQPAQTGVGLSPGAAPSAAASPDGIQLLYGSALQKKPAATEAALRKDPDALESTMDFVFEVERATANCPNSTETDRALLQLAKNQKGNVQ